MAFCICFIDCKADIQEEFVDFGCLERTSGEMIVKAIFECLIQCKMPLADISGQEYDGTVYVSISGATAMVTMLQGQSCLCTPSSYARAIMNVTKI